MKTLIIYYSFENNTKLIAENMAEEIGADLLVIKPKDEIKSAGFTKFFWGGKQALMKEMPELLPLDKNWQDYDMIFVGTPVWAWTFAPPLRTFFSANKITDKKVAIFCCHGGGKGKIFDKMKNELEGNEILGEIDFRDPLKKNTEENIKKAKTWASTLAGTNNGKEVKDN